MGYRRFVDRSGRAWEIHDETPREWTFVPVGENTDVRRTVSPPNYERDPYELSDAELQKLLDAGDGPARRHPTKSPFMD